MSVMNGYEATKEIRKEEKLYGLHIPIIGLTAHTPGSEETNKTIQAGMDACLSKPLKHDDLFQAIRYINASNWSFLPYMPSGKFVDENNQFVAADFYVTSKNRVR